MVFNYTLTKEEFLSFHKKYIGDSLKCNKFFIENMIGLIFIFLIMFISISPKFKISVVIGFSIGSIIFFIFRKQYYLNYIKKGDFKKLYSYYNLTYLFTETTLSLDKLGFSIETIMNKKTIKWKYIKDFYIVEDNVIIRSFSDYDILIPSSAIKSKECLEELIKIVEKNTAKSPQYYYPKDIEFI